MRIKFLLLFSVLLLMAPFAAFAEPTSPVEELDNISDQALQMVKLQRYEDADRLLKHFSEEFLTITGDGRPFSMDELRIITVAHDEAVEAVANADMGHAERMNKVTKFRLVIDAISSTHQPLWTEMEGPIMTVFSEMKTAAFEGNNDQFHSNLNSFLSLYNVIYPSLKIDINPETIQKIDARVSFIDQYRPQVLTEASGQEELETLESDLQNIFDEMTEDEADPSLWWVIISTGSVIILTLSYVGWRKYKGDREKTKNVQKERKN
ncbi:sporulation protein YpjB [Mesobacillus subterraneus]|uniref:Sporulation protein YpjB n=1 Tax=Mesobacillus subterraneus TaxID=285983 RepID=A0A3R9E5D7_9BACI|nr:sporulation protein YpjB [Mesobacillus subterraneus]RSD26512.1 sporulation protein YpjB [Mesobacillus subterraneus]